MKKKIGIFTTTRGDMAILTPLLKKIKTNKYFDSYLFVGGTHFNESYGNTVKEIKNLKLKINDTFSSKNKKSKDDALDLSMALSIDQQKLAKIFKKYDFDYVCLIGDRYEKISIVMNSILYKRKIAHIHGGEITLGSFDNQIRNMFSQASDLHFVICNQYKKNLIRMGIKKETIYNIGSLSVENFQNLKNFSRHSIFTRIKLNPSKKLCILNYHPPSLDTKISYQKQIKNILNILKKINMQIIVTTPGLDSGRSQIVNIIKNYEYLNENIIYKESLGFENFFHLIPHCEFIIGNSSSGVIEVPFFKVPTINVGLRQLGRFMHPSIINCDYSTLSIKKSIKKALSKKFKKRIKNMRFEFKNGVASDKFLDVLKKSN